MRKMGFTLSEVLIALTIIGVVAAISAPLVNNVIPDKNKAIVLKAHKTISDINSEILDPDNKFKHISYFEKTRIYHLSKYLQEKPYITEKEFVEILKDERTKQFADIVNEFCLQSMQ